MKNSTLTFLLFASVILNVSFLGTAGYQYYKQSAYWTSPFGMKIKKGSFLFEELSLKPEQAKQMREKAIPFRTEIDKRRIEIAQKRKELIGLMRADNPDLKAINGVVSEISGLQENMQMRVTTHMLEEKALLDRDQQKKFLDLIDNAMTEGRQAGCPPTEHN